jgi:tRNA 2-thiouridine synthesizing protein B
MLFTLAHSPQQCDLPALVRMICERDVLLLMQDGVIAGLEDSLALPHITQLPCPVYVLTEDLQARGLVGQISDKLTPIDYTGFVELTEQHMQHIAW